MYHNTINLKGKRYGRLTVQSYSHSKNGHSYWFTICSCGNKHISSSHSMRRGSSKSCGCLSKEKASKRLKSYANSVFHKKSGNPMWKTKLINYNSIHSWILNNYKKSRCQKCSSKKNLDFALKKGKKYQRIRKNFLVLCRKCHWEYDHKMI